MGEQRIAGNSAKARFVTAVQAVLAAAAPEAWPRTLAAVSGANLA